MNNNKKELVSLIISKTMIFIVVMILVNLFIGVFNNENLLVGIMSISLMLVCLSMDLTIHPVKSLLYLAGFNVGLGLLAFFATQNVILGLFINFAVMAFVGYYFSFEFIKPLNMLVGLHYIFLVAKPVSSEQLPLRLMALVVGALMIMGAQFVANRNKLVKGRTKAINGICDSLVEKIALIRAKKDTGKVDVSLNGSINNLKSMIFTSGKNDSCITEYSSNTISILSCLEKINTILDNLNSNKLDLDSLNNHKLNFDFLNDICKIVEIIKDNNFNVDLSNLETKYNESNLISLNTDEFVNIYDFLVVVKTVRVELDKYNEVHNEEKDLKNKFLISHSFKDLYSAKNLFNFKSTRVCYGLRLGLLISVSIFIVHFFHIPLGDWAVYTIFALCQPHFEYTVTKSKQRIIGTVIGAIVIAILFNIFTDPMIRTVILLTAGYLMNYMNDYRDRVFFTTICAVASVAIAAPNPNSLILSRVIFIVIGIVVSIIANKYILPRSLSDEENNINEIQSMASKKLLQEVLGGANHEDNGTIKVLSLVPSLIDLRIDHLEVNGLNMDKEYLNKNKILMNDVYMIHLLLKNDFDYHIAIDTLKEILLENDTVEVMKSKVLVALENCSCVREKFVLSKFHNMLVDFSNLWNDEEDSYELSAVLN